MVSYEEFFEKYPDEETFDGKSFEKDFPIGTKFIWCDRQKYTIVAYFKDTCFSNKNVYDHMVVFKTYSRYAQRWCYQVANTFVFYSTWEMMQRELKSEEKTKKKNGREKEL